MKTSPSFRSCLDEHPAHADLVGTQASPTFTSGLHIASGLHISLFILRSYLNLDKKSKDNSSRNMGLTSDLTDDEGEVFDDWNDPSRSSLSTFAEDGHVFPFPWDRNVTAIATGMESKLITDAGGPWKSSSPFEYPGTDKILTATLYEDSGGPASWRDATSTSTESSTQHLSVSLGIEVSAPCVSASITGEYSKNVMKNSNVRFRAVSLRLS